MVSKPFLSQLKIYNKIKPNRNQTDAGLLTNDWALLNIVGIKSRNSLATSTGRFHTHTIIQSFPKRVYSSIHYRQSRNYFDHVTIGFSSLLSKGNDGIRTSNNLPSGRSKRYVPLKIKLVDEFSRFRNKWLYIESWAFLKVRPATVCWFGGIVHS